MKTTATFFQLHEALAMVNQRYEGNISFATLEVTTGKYKTSFTLKAVSGKAGARVSNGRNIPKANWYVHGHFFDALFKINPDCIIVSLGKKITKEQGNWQDISWGANYKATSIEN